MNWDDLACFDASCPCHNPHTPSTDWESDFIEKGADIEHTRWSKWQEYFFDACEIESEDAEIVVMKLPRERYDRWMRQIATPYAELSEQEKESDRREVRSYLPLIRSLLATTHAQHKAEVENARREERRNFLKNIRKIDPQMIGKRVAYVMLDEVGEVDWDKLQATLNKES